VSEKKRRTAVSTPIASIKFSKTAEKPITAVRGLRMAVCPDVSEEDLNSSLCISNLIARHEIGILEKQGTDKKHNHVIFVW
jgi:hypothetical protein